MFQIEDKFHPNLESAVVSVQETSFATSELYTVADYDPLNDDRGSLSRGYEPTAKIMQSASRLQNPSISFDDPIFF